MDQRPKCGVKTIKLIEENVGVSANKLKFIKSKHFCVNRHCKKSEKIPDKMFINFSLILCVMLSHFYSVHGFYGM